VLRGQTTTSYTDSFKGGANHSSADKRLTVIGQASGILPGYLMLVINLNAATGAVGDGEWTLMVTKQNQDGSSAEIGRLKGTLRGGTVTFDKRGAVTSVDGIQLTIKGGTGDYAHAESGRGMFGGLSRTDESLQTFDGTLTLTF
jgi:hypothetical protein